MASTSTSPIIYRHVPKNILLVCLSLLALPITSAFTLLSLLIARISSRPSNPRAQHVSSRPRKTILVTGVSMTKGLTIARLLAQNTHHRIIGADTEPIPFTSPGRYSRALSNFIPVADPKHGSKGRESYIASLLSILQKEQVDLWISCSSVGAALEDGAVAQSAKQTLGRDFQAIQFPAETVRTFDDKNEFMEYIRQLDLPAPESYTCTSQREVEDALAAAVPREAHKVNSDSEGKVDHPAKKERHYKERKFILKSLAMNDRARNAMLKVRLPLDTPAATQQHIASLGVSKESPFLLQEYISGPEYCTHALVIRGVVKTFVACPSSDLLMHYKALSADSPLHTQMLRFTEKVAAAGGPDFTGHLSFDFIAEWKGNKVRLFPIECNPRAHTAVVLFSETGSAAAEAYLDAFEDGLSRKREGVVFPGSPCHSYYWFGHDLVTLLVLPALDMLMGNSRGKSWRWVWEQWMSFGHHLVYWRDGTYVAWDPMPFWVLYHLYWPIQFAMSLIRGEKWSRINVSTTKMFAC